MPFKEGDPLIQDPEIMLKLSLAEELGMTPNQISKWNYDIIEKILKV